MKKLFALLSMLICAVLLSSTAFAADDAYALYQKYRKKSQAVTSMEFSLVQKTTMIFGDSTADISKRSSSVKMRFTPDGKLQMEIKAVNSETGLTAFSYYKDGYMYENFSLYENADYEKLRIKMSQDEALASVSLIDGNDVDASSTKDMLKDARLENVEDGVKITYKFKLSEWKDEKGNSMDSIVMNNLKDSNLPDNFKVSFTNVTANMVFGKDNMVKSSARVYSMKLDNGNLQYKYKFNQNLKVKSVNTVAKINYPDDLNTYKTIKAS